MTNADRILAALRASTVPLDDDELSRRCGILPRQSVNQICRRLEAEGALTRTFGSGDKLVNSIRDNEGRMCLCGCGSSALLQYQPGHDARHAGEVGRELATAGASLTPEKREAILQALPSDALRAKALKIAEGRAAGAIRALPPAARGAASALPPAPESLEVAAGSSHEQRNAERVMLDLLGDRLGTALNPRRLIHESGAYVEVDGASPDLRFLVECWAHRGTAKVAQKYKLVNDAMKLAWIAKSLEAQPERLILCVSDELAVAHLRGKSWQGAAVKDLGVDIEVVDIPRELIETILAAQKRQYR
ncbi:MAG: helix-turn-helix domain-containing protein [Pedococcus sp.]